MNPNTPSLNFSIALDASEATVNELVAAIRRTFGAQPSGGVSVTIKHDLGGDVKPEELAGQQAQPSDAERVPLVEGTDEDGPRDVHGWPWNSQIHASTKGTNKDSSWRDRSRVPEDKRKEVQAAMIEAYGLSMPEAAGDAGQTPPPPPQNNTPPGPPAPPAPQTPTAAPEFTAYTNWLAGAQQANPGLTDEWLASVYQHYGATDANGGGSLAKLAELDADTITACADYVKQTHATMMMGC